MSQPRLRSFPDQDILSRVRRKGDCVGHGAGVWNAPAPAWRAERRAPARRGGRAVHTAQGRMGSNNWGLTLIVVA